MQAKPDFSLRPFVLGLAAFLVVFFLQWKLQNAEEAYLLQEKRAAVLRTAGLIRARLEGVLNSHIYLARGLAGYVVAHPQVNPADFRTIAAELIRGHRGIRSIQLARDSVVTHVYPLEGNEAAIGFRLLDRPEQRPAVKRAIDSGNTVVAGPVELVQGGTAFVSRTPIFIPQPDGSSKYWGLATLLLDRDYLYHKAGLEELTRGLRVAIRGSDGLGPAGTVFLGDPGLFEQAVVLAEVSLPNGSWQLAAMPADGWHDPSPHAVTARLVGLGLAIAAAVLVGGLAYRHHQLQQANGALTEARQQAERAAAERSRFLAAASHDVRQPLHALGLFIGELRERLTQTELRYTVDRIQLAADSLNELFDSLMDIAKLDAGVVQPQITDVPLGPLLQRLALESTPSALQKGLRLRVAATTGVARTDPVLIERVVRNLLENAIKYTECGGILLGTRRRAGRLRIEVWDTGVGIPDTELDRVFEEFHQLENPERDRRKGLGLGLAIVHRIAKLLDHPVIVRSIRGKGSLFAIELARGSKQVEPPPLYLPTGLDMRGTTVLLVDDEALVTEAVRGLLESWGCVALSATTGADAERLIGEGATPDIVLCDYRLPDTSGDRVILRLWELAGKRIPALLISGDTSRQLEEASRRIGCRYLKKPVAATKLRVLMRNTLRDMAPETQS